MDKHFKLTIKEKTAENEAVEVDLCLNAAFSYKFAQFLDISDPTPANIGVVLVRKLQEDALNTVKYLISAGIYGHEFVSNDSYTSKYKPSDIGRMILELSNDESTRLVNAVFKELGFDLKAEVQEDKKKATKKTVKKKS